MTYEELLQAMLDRVPSNVDKREGSIIYDALAPCAYFLAQQDFQLANYIDLVFPDTAAGEYLDRAVAAYGVTRKSATAAVRKVTTTGPILIGSRWGINSLVYSITKELVAGKEYEAKCGTVGDIGNQYSGALQPITESSGVAAELADIITAGTDTEADEALRERMMQKVQRPATSGNAYQYAQWALSISGVGDVKVFPLDNGPGTVTVLIVDDDKNIDTSLESRVAEYIETVRPIGATVTVSSPATKSINISATVTLDGSVGVDQVQKAFQEEVKAFLSKMVFRTYKVSHARIGSLLLDIPGVSDFESLLLNSTAANVVLGDKEIPVLGTITLTEVARGAAE